MDAPSELFALGLVMLEMPTVKNLIDTDTGVSDGAKAALSKKHLARMKRAIKRARLAGCATAVCVATCAEDGSVEGPHRTTSK